MQSKRTESNINYGAGFPIFEILSLVIMGIITLFYIVYKNMKKKE